VERRQQQTTDDTNEWRTQRETRAEALMEKKVACDALASALASIVLPLPGGPNTSNPNRYRHSGEFTAVAQPT
jgi:hypothetical protein